jgi:DNA primase
LHRRARTLHSELRAAERALAEEESEANLAWLREVQKQLSSVEGAEADLDEHVDSLGREGSRHA